MTSSAPVIVDAGPALNFFSINKERLLIDAVGGQISAPERVAQEIRSKAARDRRFQAASAVLAKLEHTRFLQLLSDEVTPELESAVLRISRVPMAERMSQPKDLGEIMVLAHAAVHADRGMDVVVLIDDGGGRDLAAIEAARLDRLRRQGRRVGCFSLMSTHDVLLRAAGRAYLPDRAAMRQIYKRLREIDDGLVDIKRTELLSPLFWSDD